MSKSRSCRICTRPARRGWTMCARHYTAGGSLAHYRQHLEREIVAVLQRAETPLSTRDVACNLKMDNDARRVLRALKRLERDGLVVSTRARRYQNINSNQFGGAVSCIRRYLVWKLNEGEMGVQS